MSTIAEPRAYITCPISWELFDDTTRAEIEGVIEQAKKDWAANHPDDPNPGFEIQLLPQ